ncbi:MAG: DEAD/DEAH box helicase [Terriglobia bacterium]
MKSLASLAWAHPLVQEWFALRFGSPTEPQEQGWPSILAGKSTLISAPTGSGKTLAAFLACIDRLIRKSLGGVLEDRTEVLYVSPLKALSNDIRKNLEVPLAEITALAAAHGLPMTPVRAAVRTGDTLAPERRAMLAQPPHILVTTPESLYILLTAEKSRALLRDVETVIVDEIHAVADDKRGAHLALSLERLEALVEQARPSRPPVRIGLSATQKPLELVARFLAGSGRAEPVMVNIGHRRALDLAVEVPRSELGPIATNDIWEEVYDRLAELAQQHRSTLVFVNTRRQSERIAHHLARRLGAEAVAAHHGSLARKVRLVAENRLKAGEVRVLVATASLELGIDIGTVDLVCQISSPHSIAVALQRVGRAGHWRGAVPKGRLFAMTRDDLIECAALVHALRQGELDRLDIPDAPLDVLAQQIVAMCASEDWNEEDLYQVVRRAYPYRDLPRQDFDALLEILSEGITARRGRYGAYLHRDRVGHRLRGRRGSRMVAITNGGAIPESALFTVVAQPDGVTVGTVAEDFAVESMGGDVFLLGNTSWRISRVEGNSGRVLVEDAHGAAPNIPFWLGEAPARTPELSAQVAAIREKVSELVAPTFRSARGDQDTHATVGVRLQHADLKVGATSEAVSWLKDQCGLDDSGAEQAVEYILAGRAMLGAVPTQRTIIAERFFDEGGGMQLIIHAPFGSRINKAWGLALRKRFCRSFNFELQAAATEDGLNISLGEQHSFPLADVFHFLLPQSAAPVLEQAALVSPIFATRWRWDATRALALPRFRNGKKIPIQIQRMRADDLLAAVFPDAAACQDNLEGDIRIPDHPLIREVMKDVLTEALDLEGLKRVLRGIGDGSIRCIAVDTPAPSQFSHEILNANPYAYLDDAPIEERRARAVSLRRVMPETVLTEIGRLDPAAIAQVREEAWPDVRDADELNEVLQVFVALPENFLPPVAQALLPVHTGIPEAGVAEPLLLVREVFSEEPNAQPRVAVLPVAALWGDLFRELVAGKRAARARVGEHVLWVAAEKVKSFLTLFPEAQFETRPVEVDEPALSRDDALVQLVRGWMEHSGPVEVACFAQIVGLPPADIESAMLRLEAEGRVLRGQFTPRPSSVSLSPSSVILSEAKNPRSSPETAESTAEILRGVYPERSERAQNDMPSAQDDTTGRDEGHQLPIEWCDRRLLARIHRLTLGAQRREIQPVTRALFMRWLLRWQHVAPGTQVSAERGVLEVIRRLQGFEAPANAWESQILARRVADYDSQILDHLCLTGTVGWGRLSPHPALSGAGVPPAVAGASRSRARERGQSLPRVERGDARATAGETPALQESARRITPSSVAPITFFVREESDWMMPRHAPVADVSRALSEVAREVLDYVRQRGASFFADIVRGTGRLKSEVETALWELVAAGLFTADGFDNLRALIDPKRRSGQGRGRKARPRHSTGRWSLLFPGEAADRSKALEAVCAVLLERYGVVFRELTLREEFPFKWRELLITFRRLEDRGEVRGGRFVDGFVGEQFALPSALESLRAARHADAGAHRDAPLHPELITLSAADPLNLVGIIIPGERVPAICGKAITLRDGVLDCSPFIDPASAERSSAALKP